MSDFGLDDVLSIQKIREHTKTTDIVQVSDDLLVLYREAALEAAEMYTGMIFTGQQTITEPVDTIGHVQKFRKRTKFTLSHPASNGIVTLVGNHLGMMSQVVQVRKGKREVVIPVMNEALDINCCNPCGQTPGENMGVMATYETGFAKATDIPAGIIYGCLKFIAWAVMNPGDDIKTVRNTETSQTGGIVGTNNGAWASGAIEHWRMYR